MLSRGYLAKPWGVRQASERHEVAEIGHKQMCIFLRSLGFNIVKQKVAVILGEAIKTLEKNIGIY